VRAFEYWATYGWRVDGVDGVGDGGTIKCCFRFSARITGVHKRQGIVAGTCGMCKSLALNPR